MQLLTRHAGMWAGTNHAGRPTGGSLRHREMVRDAIGLYGNVEGRDIVVPHPRHGQVDVVVTDGFTGNVALKTGEGVAKMIRQFMKEGFEGAPADMSDWTDHLSTLFPEVRLKKVMEVRGADCASAAMTGARVLENK